MSRPSRRAASRKADYLIADVVDEEDSVPTPPASSRKKSKTRTPKEPEVMQISEELIEETNEEAKKHLRRGHAVVFLHDREWVKGRLIAAQRGIQPTRLCTVHMANTSKNLDTRLPVNSKRLLRNFVASYSSTAEALEAALNIDVLQKCEEEDKKDTKVALQRAKTPKAGKKGDSTKTADKKVSDSDVYVPPEETEPSETISAPSEATKPDAQPENVSDNSVEAGEKGEVGFEEEEASLVPEESDEEFEPSAHYLQVLNSQKKNKKSKRKKRRKEKIPGESGSTKKRRRKKFADERAAEHDFEQWRVRTLIMFSDSDNDQCPFV